MKFLFVSVLVAFSGVSRADVTSDESIFQVDAQFKNQDGQRVKLKSFAGKPVILSMIYLSCQYTCPAIVSEVREIIDQLPADQRKKVSVLLVSFDPAHDKPADLKSFMEKRKLDSSQWTLLTADKDSDVRELAVLLDFKYEKEKGRDFTHSYLVAALDEKGVVRARNDRANQDHKGLIEALSKKDPPP